MQENLQKYVSSMLALQHRQWQQTRGSATIVVVTDRPMLCGVLHPAGICCTIQQGQVELEEYINNKICK